jgi:hypothetical protein
MEPRNAYGCGAYVLGIAEAYQKRLTDAFDARPYLDKSR